MFLSRLQIFTDIQFLLDDYDASLIHDACYDLRVGNEIFLSEGRPYILTDDDPFVSLPAGQFALVKTQEKILMPLDRIGFVSIRTKYKLQGLINISGFHVDPGYRGNLIFAIQNVGPHDIVLRYKEPAFMIMWAELKTGAAGDKKANYGNIPVELMAQLGGGSVTLSSLKKEIDSLSTSLKIYGAIIIGVFMAIIGILIKELMQRPP
jgi:dCTP deaminase